MTQDQQQIREIIAGLGSQDVDQYHSALDRARELGERAVQPLTEVIKSRGASAHGAVEALKEIGMVTLELVDVLLDYYSTAATRYGQESIRCTLCEAEGDAFQRLVFHLHHNQRDEIRLAVVETFYELYDETILPAVRQSLTDPSPEIRERAAAIIGHHQDKAAIPTLMRLAEDDHADVRGAVAEAFGQLRDPQVVPSLLRMLDDVEPFVRSSAVSALGVVGSSSNVSQILPLLEDQTGFVRDAALRTICQIGDKTQIELIVQATSHPEMLVRCDAVQGLERLQVASSIDAIRTCLHDEWWIVRGYAARAVGVFKDHESVPALIEIIETSNHWGDEADAAIALGELNAEDGVPAIISLLPLTHLDYSNEERVSDVAVRVLRKLGTPEALDALKQYEHRRG